MIKSFSKSKAGGRGVEDRFVRRGVNRFIDRHRREWNVLDPLAAIQWDVYSLKDGTEITVEL